MAWRGTAAQARFSEKQARTLSRVLCHTLYPIYVCLNALILKSIKADRFLGKQIYFCVPCNIDSWNAGWQSLTEPLSYYCASPNKQFLWQIAQSYKLCRHVRSLQAMTTKWQSPLLPLAPQGFYSLLSVPRTWVCGCMPADTWTLTWCLLLLSSCSLSRLISSAREVRNIQWGF